MEPTIRTAILLAGLLLAACGKSSTDPVGPDLLKTQREAMDKAKGTEQVIQDAAKKQDTQMEQQAK
jgi:hypothetical protein